jgi:hypothetical protein
MPQHAQEQALAPAISTKKVASHITGHDLGVEGYFQQLTGLHRRAVGNGKVTSE